MLSTNRCGNRWCAWPVVLVLIVAVAGGPQTAKLIDAAVIAALGPSGTLVNVSRGAVVDSAALVSALESGHLGGAGLDVFEIEPLPTDHPILRCQQIVLTPHAADQTPEGVELLNQGAVENVLAYLDGRPRNVVNAEEQVAS